MGVLIRITALVIHELLTEIRKLEDRPPPDESVPSMTPMEFPQPLSEDTVVANRIGFDLARREE